MTSASVSQPGSASVSETLKNMNSTSAKHATWLVRVLDPKIIKYQFTARGQLVQAEKFECILVSENPKEYMMATVPFSFSDRAAAARVMKTYKALTSYEIRTPQFDTKQKQEYISCPVKRVVILTDPTRTAPIPPTEQAKQQYPSMFVDVGRNLTETMKVLTGMRFNLQPSGPASGSAKLGAQCLDVCGKILSLTGQKPTEKRGKRYMVANMELVDDLEGKVEVNVWDNAYKLVKDIPLGEGVTLIGCTATKDPSDNATKLNLWDSAHVLSGGTRAQSLTSL